MNFKATWQMQVRPGMSGFWGILMQLTSRVSNKLLGNIYFCLKALELMIPKD
jgi:hypothetical protein